MIMTKVTLVIQEPVEIAGEHEWEEAFEHEIILPLGADTVWSWLFAAVGPQKHIKMIDGQVVWIYEWDHQNSPEIDQNSLPRRFQIQVSEFSGKTIPKWEPLTDRDTVDCYCDEPGCEAGLTIDNENGDLITVGNAGHIQTIDLPPNIRVCKLVE